MDLLSYLYLISLIMLIYGFIWKWVVVFPVVLFFGAIGNTSFFPVNLLNAIGHFLLASFIALAGLGITMELETGYSLLIFVAGGVVMALQGLNNMNAIRKDAEMNRDYETLDNLPYSVLALLFGLVMYVVILFIPAILNNPVTIWFIDWIEKISNMPYIGAIIGFFAVLNALNIVFMGIIAVLVLGASGVSLFTKKPSDKIYELPPTE